MKKVGCRECALFFKTTLASAVLAGVLGLLFLGIGVVIYGRTGGKELAEKLGVPRPAIIAHRGASYFAPEETDPAFLLAREMDVDYLELDLQRSKDGVLIAVHDDDLRRTTNIADMFPGREMDTVDKFTFAELQTLDAGSWFNIRFPDRARASFKNVRILRLEDVMNIAEGGFHKPGLPPEAKSLSSIRRTETRTHNHLLFLESTRPLVGVAMRSAPLVFALAA